MKIHFQQPPITIPMPISNCETNDALLSSNDIGQLNTVAFFAGEQERILLSLRQFSSLLETKGVAHAEVLQMFDAFFPIGQKKEISESARLDSIKAEHHVKLSSAIDSATVTDHLLNPQIAIARSDFLREVTTDKLQESAGNLTEIWKELSDLIEMFDKDDLSQYASALEQYRTLYQWITDIVSSLEDYVGIDGDNHMRVDFKKIENALNAVLGKYNPPTNNVVIAGKTPSNGMESSEAVDACKRLGLDPLECIHANKDGTFCIIPDLSQIKKQIADLPRAGGGAVEDNRKISITAYNVWKSGFDSQVSRIEDSLQTRGQKYSNAYGRFESAHKTISSIIQSMTDMLRSFLQF